jgi:alpha/beta superfamily hydrolase
MKAPEFDRQFDIGEDVSDAIDWSQAQRPNDAPKRVNVDFPAWVVSSLDKQARHLGVTRQSLIKLWIAERLQQTTENTTNITG